MAIARFKDLCVDVGDIGVEAGFWAITLGLRPEPDADEPAQIGRLAGERPEQTVWLNIVPEPKTAKNRVHLDVHTGSVEALVALGATAVSAPGEFRWTVLAAPGGQEFCAFVRDPVPAYRLYELVVDCADPDAQAGWWSAVWGGTVGADDGYTWIDDVPGLPFDGIVFVPVPEPKTVKNRVHWDVTVSDESGVTALLAHGATMLRRRGDDIRWDVLADPEGNEFCVFVEGID